jgi:DNA-binding MarR family transcriptional regulator
MLMDDIRIILSKFHSKKKLRDSEVQKSGTGPSLEALTSSIPDLFFDEILHRYKLTRQEIILLMYLYRQVWARANLYKTHGIGPLNSYVELAAALHFTQEELSQNLRSLENYGLIETVRSGQYFVRRYLIEEFDQKYGQDYDEFF